MTLTRNHKIRKPEILVTGLGYGHINNTHRTLTLMTTVHQACIIHKLFLSVSKNHKKIFVTNVLIGNKCLLHGVEAMPITHKNYEFPIDIDKAILPGQCFTVEIQLPETSFEIPPLKDKEVIIVSGYLIAEEIQ